MDKYYEIIKILRLVDILCLGYSTLMLAIITLFGSGLPEQTLIIVTYSSCISVAVLMIYLRRFNNPFLNYCTRLYPLALLIPFYEIAGKQIHLIHSRFFDSSILAMENALFTTHPVIWFEKLYNPLLNEWMLMGYTTYLVLIPITTSWFYFKKMNRESEHLLGSLLCSLFFCYILFFLIPVTGPRFAMVDQFVKPLEGFLFRPITIMLEQNAMLHGGAFPSAHCAAGAVMLILAHRYDKLLFKWTSPILITLFIATVYGRYHYPLDVVAGIAVGAAGILVADKIMKAQLRYNQNR